MRSVRFHRLKIAAAHARKRTSSFTFISRWCACNFWSPPTDKRSWIIALVASLQKTQLSVRLSGSSTTPFLTPHTFCSGQRRMMCMTDLGGCFLIMLRFRRQSRVLWQTIFCLVEKRKIVDLEYNCETHVVTTARKVFLSKDKLP